MKIAVFHELPPGGAKDSALYIAEGLKKNGHVVDLYYVSEEEDRINNLDKIYFYKFENKKWIGGDWKAKLYKDTLELYRLYNLHKRIAKKIDSKNYDLVFVNGSKYIEAPFLLKLLSTYKIFYCHDPNYRLVYEKLLSIHNNLDFLRHNYESLNRMVRKYLDRRNFLNADLIMANSKYAQKIIKETYGRDSKVLYLGVDTKLFSPKESVVRDIDVLYIGSHEPIDGYSLLESAFEYLPRKLNVKTIMYEDEWISDKQVIRDLYRHSKVVVCLAHNEPFGLTPLEAMACGTPVVAVNEGGYPESVINNKTGFLVKRDSHVLAGKIKELIDNKEVLESMGTNCRIDMVNNWDWKVKSRKFSDAINSNLK